MAVPRKWLNVDDVSSDEDDGVDFWAGGAKKRMQIRAGRAPKKCAAKAAAHTTADGGSKKGAASAASDAASSSAGPCTPRGKSTATAQLEIDGFDEQMGAAVSGGMGRSRERVASRKRQSMRDTAPALRFQRGVATIAEEVPAAADDGCLDDVAVSDGMGRSTAVTVAATAPPARPRQRLRPARMCTCTSACVRGEIVMCGISLPNTPGVTRACRLVLCNIELQRTCTKRRRALCSTRLHTHTFSLLYHKIS